MNEQEMNLDTFLNITDAVDILARHFQSSTKVDFFQIQREGIEAYEKRKVQLNKFLSFVNDTEVKAYLSTYDVSPDLQESPDRNKLIFSLFQISNFHQLDSISIPSELPFRSIFSKIKEDIAKRVRQNNIDEMRRTFEGYFSINMFLRVDLLSFNFLKGEDFHNYASSDYDLKYLIGNFFPSSTALNYEIPDNSSYVVSKEHIRNFPLGPTNDNHHPILVSQVLNLICYLLNENFKVQLKTKSEIKNNEINRSPDFVLNFDGHSKQIPMEFTNFSFDEYVGLNGDKTNNDESGIHMNEMFTQVLRHCFASNFPIGILANYTHFLGIDFTSSVVSQTFYKLNEGKTLRSLSCTMLNLRSALHILIL
ncbi:uncharacterized protein RJT21DRAFT_5466 [Scheffersomyces amazonensis]|uniref:uncharacterized protein n=1 Tax=Scheffersomyces amazonensis TaxID=1078765 RepID=UPI00315CD62A